MHVCARVSVCTACAHMCTCMYMYTYVCLAGFCLFVVVVDFYLSVFGDTLCWPGTCFAAHADLELLEVYLPLD